LWVQINGNPVEVIYVDADGVITFNLNLAATTLTGNVTGNLTGNADTATTLAGVLSHELGGLEANVSAYDGLIKITGGSSSNVTSSQNLEDALTGMGAFFSDLVAATSQANTRSILGLDTGDSPTFTAATVNTDPYDAGWEDDNTVPDKDALFDKFESLAGAELNDLETVCTDIANTEIAIGTAGGGTALYAAISGQSSMTAGGVMTNTGVALDDETSIDIMGDPDGMDDDEYNGIVVSGIETGEAGGVDQWELVYLKGDDVDPLFLASATQGEAKYPAFGIVVADANDSAPVIVLVQGVVINENWDALAVGSPVYLGETDNETLGGMLTVVAPSTANDCVQIVGWAISPSEIYFDFSRPYQLVE